MPTPYVTPAVLINAPTGISWETIPDFDSTSDAQLAEQFNICWRATHFIDTWCNQPLRATIDTEEILGPDYRFIVDNNGLGRAITSRWPVTEIISGKYASSASYPVNWQTIPTDAMFIENPISTSSGVSVEAAAGSSAIRITPGFLDWSSGRNGLRFQITYINGWAHAGITATASADATTLQIDDCTGMLNGTIGRGLWIYDGAQTEYVVASAVSAPSGPGTLTIASPLLYEHDGTSEQPVLISSMPSVIQEAAIFHASYQAMVRGATATTVQQMPGSTSKSSDGISLLQDCKDMLIPFRRTI